MKGRSLPKYRDYGAMIMVTDVGVAPLPRVVPIAYGRRMEAYQLATVSVIL